MEAKKYPYLIQYDPRPHMYHFKVSPPPHTPSRFCFSFERVGQEGDLSLNFKFEISPQLVLNSWVATKERAAEQRITAN